MRIAARAWAIRRERRAALERGDLDDAFRLSKAAEALQRPAPLDPASQQ
jgi:hypothetical protein